MTLDTVSPQQALLNLMFGDPPVRDLARAIRDSALAKALRDRRAYAGDEALLELDLRRPAVLESVKDGLAQGAARALAARVAQISAIYTYDPSANADNETGEDRPFDPVVHCLVRLAGPAPELPEHVAALDRALVESLREVPALAFWVPAGLLDVIVLTEAEVQQGAGYGALLGSVFAPAIEIWRR